MDLSCFNWVQLVKKSDLPANAKYLSLYLSTFMNAEHDIAWPSQLRISNETGLSKPTVIKWLEYLNTEGWLIKRKSAREIMTAGGPQLQNEYLINIPEKVVKQINPHDKGSKTVGQRGLNESPKGVKQFNPNNNINNNMNNNSQKNKFSDEDVLAATYMFQKIQGLNLGDKKPNLEKWANDIRLMRERDDRTMIEIRSLFDWANNHEFWSSNIRSPHKLRAQWSTLVGQRKRGKANGTSSTLSAVDRVNNAIEERERERRANGESHGFTLEADG